ncbi:MATE family efflux transporter [Alteraurantiacibacter buctensis]|uniref:MATE family efflux transporter n=1 Tax=Alteraurantiacibacter buctensis TaxID=1503981 RepID=A0A844Z1H5_9SPHN|nr:MATE family efflux transporter [Alteraurantiacibacter buctensis]MXO73198.1 MATE family efflux transporter [Alteraurantiacibacter buctensis]
MSEKARLTRGSVAGHLLHQTTPMIVGVAAIMSIGLVDAYFIGQLGAGQLAAMSFVFPVTTALGSVGVGVMVGTSSVVARAIGAGDEERASRCAALGVALGLATGLAVAVALLLGQDALFAAMGARGAVAGHVANYMLPYALGFPLLLTISGLNGVLRAQGAAKSSTVVSLVFAGANLVLTPLLVPLLGVPGAALATIAGWLMGAGTGLWLVRRGEVPLRLALLRRGNLREPLRQVLRVALPAAFTNSINPVGLALLTGCLASEGAAAVAGFGVGGRLQLAAVVPLLGLSGSIGAIVGQNWGAGQHDRARQALWQAGLFCLGYGLLAGLVLYALRGWLAGAFSEDAATIAAAREYLSIGVWGYAMFGLFIVANGAMNAVDRAGTAMALSITRSLLVMVPFAILTQPLWDAKGVYFAELVANIAGGSAAVLVAWLALKGPPARR